MANRITGYVVAANIKTTQLADSSNSTITQSAVKGNIPPSAIKGNIPPSAVKGNILDNG